MQNLHKHCTVRRHRRTYHPSECHRSHVSLTYRNSRWLTESLRILLPMYLWRFYKYTDTGYSTLLARGKARDAAAASWVWKLQVRPPFNPFFASSRKCVPFSLSCCCSIADSGEWVGWREGTWQWVASYICSFSVFSLPAANSRIPRLVNSVLVRDRSPCSTV